MSGQGPSERSGSTTPVTEDSVPSTPPRNKDLSKKSGNFDGEKDSSGTIGTTVIASVRANSGEPPLTPERAQTETSLLSTGMLTPVRSRPGTPAWSDSPYHVTPIPSQFDLDLDSKSGEHEKDKVYPKWSVVLKTSSEGGKYSPSKALNKPGSLHGLGLMVATDRAKKLSQSGRRCAMLLSDVAGLQDNFAQALSKASFQANISSSPISKTLVGVNRSRISFAKQLQGLAICVRGSVARPLHSTMASLGDTAPSIYQRYAATRVSCATARQAALRAQAKYVKAVKDAEAAIRDLRQAKLHGEAHASESGNATVVDPLTDVPSSTDQSPWEVKLRSYGEKNGVSTDGLIVLLKQVETFEAEYRKLVKEENQAVLQAQTMEVMALEAAQKLEEERLQFFVESMNRMLTAEKGALDNMLLSAEVDATEGVPDESSSQEKNRPNDFFKKILKKDSQEYEEGIGLMEAATLGLPEDVGSLRDEVKSCIAARASRGQVARALATLIEEVASAAIALASGLEARIGQEGYNDKSRNRSADPLVAVMRRSEGPHVGKHWDAIVASISETAASARQLAYDLRSIRQEKLDAFMLRFERDCKTASEGDGNRWKHLCECARNESKAQMRFQEATAQFEKARDRVRSVDSELAASEYSEGKGKRMNAGVSRALGNVFSILPDGGEQAMQAMLSDDTRLQIAKTTLKEADEKESKEKKALDSAMAAKAQSLTSYKAKAENLVFTFKKEDAAGWIDAENAMMSLLSAFDAFRSDRYNSIDKATSDAASDEAQLSDIAEWTSRASIHIAKKAEKVDEQKNLSNNDPGFSLKVELEESKMVYKLLCQDVSDSEEPALINAAAPRLTASDDPSSKENENADGKDLLDSPDGHFEIPTLRKRLSTAEKEELSLPGDTRSSDENDKIEGEGASTKGEIGQCISSDEAENALFLSHFWQDRGEDEGPPSIIDSFSCAYWPKEGEGHLSPLLHGRLFLTPNTMYFVGWGEKKIVLDLADVVDVKKAKNLLGTIDNSLRIIYTTEEGESSYFFGSFAFRDKALELLQRLSLVTRSLRELNGPPKVDNANAKANALPPVPHDQVIKKMEVVLSKKIKNVSIQRFYELVWSEGHGTDAKPFYGPWLKSMGSHKVNVGTWEIAENEGFVNKWCGEKYDQRRRVSFEFTRKTHLYIGPPIAGVKQTHHCLIDGNDKFVLEMTVEMEGIPYADCFAVEVRWVARRVGACDIHIEVGVFVDFKKSTMFAKKIRAGTLEETKPVHHKLFESARASCLAEAGEIAEAVEEEEEVQEVKPVAAVESQNELLGMLTTAKDVIVDNMLLLLAGLVGLLFLSLASSLFGPGASTSASDTELLNQRIDELHDEMREIRLTLDEILQVLNEKND